MTATFVAAMQPYGTLILTLSVIGIEAAMLAALMLNGEDNPTLARDTMFSVSRFRVVVHHVWSHSRRNACARVLPAPCGPIMMHLPTVVVTGP